MTRRQIVMLLPTLAAVGMTYLTPTQAHAQECLAELRDCFASAAGQDGFWGMWLGGIDCEVGFVECARRVIVGR